MFDYALLLWPFFWLGVAIVFVYGLSLLYHWIRYAYMYPLVWIVLPVYVVGTLVFIGALLVGMTTI